MRIQKLEFRNLNSLVGSFCIDFEHPSLADAGVFAIFGPTGAGKTTILDAVSYALYAETPRQSKNFNSGISPSANELMSRCAKDCMARVTFEIGGIRYVVATEQRRARARSDNGKPFSPPLRKLEVYGEDRRLHVLSVKKKEVDERIEEITGLTFDNFRRCMLLAQGEFANFLRADKKERSEVLSTITGTEIYAKIGEKALERYHDLEQQKKALPMREVLGREAREEKRLECQDREARDVQWREATAACRSELKLLDDLEEYDRRCSSASALADEARKKLTLFELGGEAEMLRLAAAAKELLPLEQRRRDAEGKLKQTRETIARCISVLNRLEPKLEHARKRQTLAEEERKKLTPSLLEQQKLIREKLYPLEKKCYAAQQQLLSARKECQKASENASIENQLLQEAQRRYEQHADEQSERKRRIETIKEDALLLEHLHTLAARFQDWKECGNSKEKLPPLEHISRALQTAVHHREYLLKGSTQDELAEKLLRLDRLRENNRRLKESMMREHTARERYSTAQSELASLPSLAQAIHRQELAEKNVDKIRALTRLQDQLSDLYAKFVKGELERCPCCGSATPGKHRETFSQKELDMAEAVLKEAKRELLRAHEEHSTAKQRLAKEEASLAAARQDVSTARQARQAALAEFEPDAASSDLETMSEELKKALKECDLWNSRIKELEAVLATAKKREAFLQELRPFSPESPMEIREADVALKRLRERAATYSALLREVNEGEKQVAADRIAWEHARKNREAALQIERETKTAEREFERQQQMLANQRSALWQCHETAAEADGRLTNAMAELQNAAREAAEQFNALHSRHSEQRAILETKRRDEEAETHQQIEATEEFRRACSLRGFGHEFSYEKAREHVPQLENLQAKFQRLREEKLRRETTHATLLKEKEACLQKRTTRESRETLMEKLQSILSKAEENQSCIAAIKGELLADDRNREANKMAQQKADELQQQLNQWDLLRQVLGTTSSKDGFKDYAQQITFDALIHSANQQLALLSDRYILRSKNDGKLGLEVIDLWQDGERGRDCSNLSGGESFIVSLALALGLSRLSGSHTNIDTLFLDEGFGTLDRDALDRVLDSLDRLRAEGKLIGLISHVEELKERMPPTSRIEVCPIRSSGRSTLAPHPAVRIQ